MLDPATTEAEIIQSVLDAKYTPADIGKMASNSPELQETQRNSLEKLLRKSEPLFDGTLGHWKADPVDLFLKDPDCTPYHAKPYPVPYSQERKLKDEIERMCTAGVMQRINRSEWEAPMFTITKPDLSLRSLAGRFPMGNFLGFEHGVLSH
jgi:hypothetical protein